MMNHISPVAFVFLTSLIAAAMGIPSYSEATPVSGCTGQCANASTFLSSEMVERIISQAFNEAKAAGATAVTIAVVDRVGNVLGVFESKKALEQFSGVGGLVFINSGRFNLARPQPLFLSQILQTSIPTDPSFQTGVGGKIPNVRNQGAGLENIQVPSSVAAISKAITGAYLSSEGNAFSSYTAAQIIQEHFNPGVTNQPAGPLFGVQFSQLPCGDFVTQGSQIGVGPRRSPLGFSGQRGGLPLYFKGTPVGGIGVIATTQYAIELNINDPPASVDEQIAIAGSYGFVAPYNRRADVIQVGGLTFRYTSISDDKILSNPAKAPALSDVIASGEGNYISVPGYFETTSARAGTAFSQPASGIAPATAPFTGLKAYMMTDANGNNRYPPIDGVMNQDQQLTASDVTTLLSNVVKVANSARAQIRQPLPTNARLSGAIVDLDGNILGILRAEDAPVFSTDVALQKARTAAFFTQPNAASLLNATLLSPYVKNAQSLIPRATRGKFLADGTAMTPRAMGNLARPLLPDGIFQTPNGPFSLPYQPVYFFEQGLNQWSPFNIGIQLDLSYSDLLYAITNPFTNATGGTPIQNCAASNPNLGTALANGPQLFAGGVPLYKAGVLVGAIGTSGDGIDQDDMGSFLSAYRTGLSTSPQVKNAKTSIRSNLVKFNDGRQTVALRFVECPFAPFLNSKTQKACSGK